METIVIGHKNPDMDSVCSAIAYAHLKSATGMERVVAGRAGDTNARIDHVLRRFGFEAPAYLADVSPRVSDVMERRTRHVSDDSSVSDALRLMEEHRLRALPVTDASRRCLGFLSALQITRHIFPKRDPASAPRRIRASLAQVAELLGAECVTGEIEREPTDLTLMVAAMHRDTLQDRLAIYEVREVVVFVGDRHEIQHLAIDAGVRAIVITGGIPVDPAVVRAASLSGVCVLRSPHDTATSVLLARGAVQVGGMIDPEFKSFRPDTPLELAREEVAASSAFVFPVLDEGGCLVGVLTKSDFLKPIPRQLILVDHNELSQAADGADRLPILEVLDHHRLGGLSSATPVLFWNNPVGSTCTIVALCYRQAGVPIPGNIAGLLMAGLISDTLNLTSPTATPVDAEILGHLSARAGVEPAALAEEIFSVGSPLQTMEPARVVTADCKDYEEGGVRFSVSQIEELSFAGFADREASIREALEAHRRTRGLQFAALLVTDVNTQDSLLLAAGEPALLRRIDYPQRSPGVWDLPGVVSRKKQLVPHLIGCIEAMRRAGGG